VFFKNFDNTWWISQERSESLEQVFSPTKINWKQHVSKWVSIISQLFRSQKIDLSLCLVYAFNQQTLLNTYCVPSTLWNNVLQKWTIGGKTCLTELHSSHRSQTQLIEKCYSRVEDDTYSRREKSFNGDMILNKWTQETLTNAETHEKASAPPNICQVTLEIARYSDKTISFRSCFPWTWRNLYSVGSGIQQQRDKSYQL
jgi:hypothetical protein